MPSPLAANINDGILIDMSLFTGISYDPGSHVATIGTGHIWRNVYSHLEQYNVTVVGGRVLEVGVGGLILGCGLSYLSDLYGLACDNVVNYEVNAQFNLNTIGPVLTRDQVVLANGSIVDANATFNTDLWWALKGGGNNFGVVTAFSLSTHPIHEVWGGVKVYSYNNTPAVLSAMSQYQSEPNKDPYANLITQIYTTNSSIGVVLTMVYLKPEIAPAAFAPFYSIPTVLDTTKIQTFSQVMGGQSVPAIPRFDWFTTTFQPSNSLYQHLNNIITTAPELKTLISVTAGALALAFQPISASVVHAGNARGGNALGLQPVNQTWFALDTSHFSPADDAVAHNATRGIHERIETLTRSNGSYLPYLFMNDASYDQDVLAHYGAANLRRLRDVRAKYDPDLVFQKLVPGGFKLG
ncbi:MAG: hypothetical protein L6R36_004297 [Xanthoria steineri]|nr:MAG: hypothetical protein L6R36_004297 [Xanthoria steineri]